ncbi:DUF4249 domain-containing protein [Hymenobacter sp. BT635]|uniref:DUF4249 domain-containing protein n=1 Tax=Hymenobacter nitidus TaxID=2880929 RepID=A0ABS8ADK3_9BACT|nr:DUF4249 domain-containing protein [Hymenobacter nitidus]MCB2378490.1 DUF4249 domain-containing protein [Hymenobacter nitidus]
MPLLKQYFLWLLLVLALPGCVDPFEPDVLDSPPKYLVVNGFINLSGVTTIRLSRTQSIAGGAAPLVEPKATVTIVDETGAPYTLTEQTPGTYVSAALNLSPGRKYQLRLRTAAGREYASALVAAKVTPPIESLRWALENGRVQVYVNTRDATNSTRYYRWSYAETWQFETPYYSGLEYVGGRVQPRTEDVSTCWTTVNSSSIELSSTARLSQDVVANFPLVLLPGNSVKLRVKYSVLVRQYAQTPEEYAYWELLKANTETVGSLFDPVPSQLTGNVRSLTDDTETVIGYVGASTETQKRLFISSSELPATVYETGYKCPRPDTVLLGGINGAFGNGAVVPLFGVYGPPLTSILVGYATAPADCADCRRRGTNKRPDFWQ